MKININMVLERTTKGALRYQEVNLSGRPLGMASQETVIGTLYLRKWGLQTQGVREGYYPNNITVVIEIPDEVE